MQAILCSFFLMLSVITIRSQYTPPINVPQLCKTVAGRLGSHFVRNPNNCSMIYNCNGDLSFPVLLHCQYPLVFSQSQQVCVHRNGIYDDCDKTVFMGGYNSPVCRPRPDGMNRDPSSCNRFIPCWKGNAYPSMPCQGELQFSFEQQSCVEPGKAKCYPQN